MIRPRGADMVLGLRCHADGLRHTRKRLLIAGLCEVAGLSLWVVFSGLGPIGALAILGVLIGLHVWVAVELTLVQVQQEEDVVSCVAHFLVGLIPAINLIPAGVAYVQAGRSIEVADRARRVRCFACGYELRSLRAAVCPECGAPVKNIGDTAGR